jgi:hypothetical protein
MVGYLSKKPKLSFVDDLGKLYRQRRRATQAKGLETLDSKIEVEGPSESPRESPPPSPKEDQPKPTSLIYLSESGYPRISPCPRWCGSGYPRLQRPQRALIQSNRVKKSSHGL